MSLKVSSLFFIEGKAIFHSSFRSAIALWDIIKKKVIAYILETPLISLICQKSDFFPCYFFVLFMLN